MKAIQYIGRVFSDRIGFGARDSSGREHGIFVKITSYEVIETDGFSRWPDPMIESSAVGAPMYRVHYHRTRNGKPFGRRSVHLQQFTTLSAAADYVDWLIKFHEDNTHNSHSRRPARRSQQERRSSRLGDADLPRRVRSDSPAAREREGIGELQPVR